MVWDLEDENPQLKGGQCLLEVVLLLLLLPSLPNLLSLALQGFEGTGGSRIPYLHLRFPLVLDFLEVPHGERAKQAPQLQQ